MPEGKKEEIRVEDKRHFDKEGNVINPETEAAKSEEPAPAEKTSATHSSEENPEKIDFISILLFSFVHPALIYLGDVEDPIQKKTAQNLEAAQQMIDILELIQEKTKGNLADHEIKFLESSLFDLRMRYMKKAKLIQ